VLSESAVKNTVYQLNISLEHTRLRFRRDGTPSGVTWEVLSPQN
jgi:hypothetical protein